MTLSELLSPFSIGHCRVVSRVIAAPMAGITDLPFRTILKSCGAGLTFSEMVSVEALIRGHRKTYGILQRADGEVPFGIQLFGGNPDALAKAARQLEREQRCELIDINLGCPAKKVIRSGSGAALMREKQRLFMSVGKVVDAVSLPVTVKMRACDRPGDLRGVKLIPELFSRGIKAVFLHARCVSWNFSHPPEWKWIEMAVGMGRPIVGNGGILSPEDAVKMVERTGCDGVMVARGMLGNPWIFREIQQIVGEGKAAPVSFEERVETMKRHLSLSIRTFGEKQGILKMRKHLAWYVKGLPLASDFRGRINRLEDKRSILEEIRRYSKLIYEKYDNDG